MLANTKPITKLIHRFIDFLYNILQVKINTNKYKIPFKSKKICLD